MNKNQVKNIVEYWQKTAKRDYKTMIGLFKIKRYPESLFFGHIALEKILKGLVVKKTEKQAPYTHDLLRLQELAELRLKEDDLNLFRYS